MGRHRWAVALLSELDEAGRRRLAGEALAVAGTLITVGIVVAGALYPDYSIHTQTISELGATGPSGERFQPAAAVFTLAMALSGVLVVLAGTVARSELGRRLASALVITGTGVVGVAVFPLDVGGPHAIAALVAFAGGGLTALFAAWETRGAIRWLSVLFGASALVALLAFLVLGGETPLGRGGLERVVSLPIQCWTIVFGGWLIGTAHEHSDRDPRT
ncbi:DUF998 domain-containing protein [Halorhabdus sp. CUG00001]|uniref:DUF998 domain-containing protein n=1 Tax=Halorhabdus sp. CUG00001 TaxID=2600297 RepID=UPI00131ABA3F|nr:DUF998 domain-containing protein [Halorhabdus sp. CUG00001]